MNMMVMLPVEAPLLLLLLLLIMMIMMMMTMEQRCAAAVLRVSVVMRDILLSEKYRGIPSGGIDDRYTSYEAQFT